MVDWNDIKNAFERDAKKAEGEFLDKEQKLLKKIAVHVCSQKGMTAVQGYHPEEILEFLQKPVSEIRPCIGAEWNDMSDNDLETLLYTLSKKVKKSDSLMPWT